MSQILPKVTVCLVAEPGSLTIIENHSEYMINRTKREVAIKRAEPESLQLFFVERGDEQTIVREGNLNGSSGFEYWPKGFFSQTEDELLEILRAIENS